MLASSSTGLGARLEASNAGRQAPRYRFPVALSDGLRGVKSSRGARAVCTVPQAWVRAKTASDLVVPLDFDSPGGRAVPTPSVDEVRAQAALTSNVQAIILAGGSNQNPLCSHRAVGALPVAGSFRVIDMAISSILQTGINQVYVLTQYNSASLNTYLARQYRPSMFGSASHMHWIDVITATQTPTRKTWTRGSADAVRMHLPTMLTRWHGAPLPERFVIMSAEALASMDMRGLLAEHVANGSDISMATTTVSAQEAVSMGLVSTDASGCVTVFQEKPTSTNLDKMAHTSAASTAEKPFEASMGAYVFERDVLVDLLKNEAEATNFGADILPRALEQGYNLRAVHNDTHFANVKNLSAYFQFNMRLARREESMNKVLSHMEGCAGSVLPPTRLTGACTTQAALLGEGCLIDNARLSDVVVGPNTLIRGPAVIEQSVLLGSELTPNHARYDAARAAGEPTMGFGKNLRMKRVVADNNVSVGDNCVLTNTACVTEADLGPETGGIIIREGLIVLPRNCIVPDGTIV